MHIFISYSKRNKPAVQTLADLLDLIYDPTPPRDHVAWYDADLARTAGQRWWKVICDEIRVCDVFVFATSPESLASTWCSREVQFAHDLQKHIVPVLLIDVPYAEQPIWIKQRTCAPFLTGDQAEQKALKRVISNLPAAAKSMPGIADPKSPYDDIEKLYGDLNARELTLSQQRAVFSAVENLWYDFRNERDQFLDAELVRLINQYINRNDTAQEMTPRLNDLRAKIDGTMLPVVKPSVPVAPQSTVPLMTDPGVQLTYSVFLQDCGPRKIDLIKKVREYNPLGLKEAKDLIESAPVTLLEGIELFLANQFRRELEELGAKVEVKMRAAK